MPELNVWAIPAATGWQVMVAMRYPGPPDVAAGCTAYAQTPLGSPMSEQRALTTLQRLAARGWRS